MLGGKPSRSDLDHTDVLSRRPFHGLQGRNHECRKVCRSCRRTRGSPRNRRSILHRPASRLGNACRQRVVSGGVRPVVKLWFGRKRFSENRQSGIEQHRTVERPQAVYPVQCGGWHRRRRQHFEGREQHGYHRQRDDQFRHGDSVVNGQRREPRSRSQPGGHGNSTLREEVERDVVSAKLRGDFAGFVLRDIPPQRHGSESYGCRRPARAVGGRDAASVVEP